MQSLVSEGNVSLAKSTKNVEAKIFQGQKNHLVRSSLLHAGKPVDIYLLTSNTTLF